MTSIEFHTDGEWRGGRPLCRAYQLVHFAIAPTQVAAALPAGRVTWALGTVSDGSHEVLGAWQHSTDGALNWQQVFEDLAARGIDQIRFVVRAEASSASLMLPAVRVIGVSMRAPAQRVPRSARTRHAGGSLDCDSDEVPLRVRRLVRHSGKAAQLLQQGLMRAATRHGPVESPHAAAAFVAEWLESAERRERRRRLATQHQAAVAAAALMR